MPHLTNDEKRRGANILLDKARDLDDCTGCCLTMLGLAISKLILADLAADGKTDRGDATEIVGWVTTQIAYNTMNAFVQLQRGEEIDESFKPLHS